MGLKWVHIPRTKKAVSLAGSSKVTTRARGRSWKTSHGTTSQTRPLAAVGAGVVLGDDARAREEEVAAVVRGAYPWPDAIRQLKAARPGRVREAHKLGHRVAHRLPAQPRTDVCAGGEEAGPLAAIRGARLYVDNSVARSPSKPGDAAAWAHVVVLASELAVGFDDDVVPRRGIVVASPLSQPRDERAAGGRSCDLQIAVHFDVVAQVVVALRNAALAAAVVEVIDNVACLEREPARLEAHRASR